MINFNFCGFGFMGSTDAMCLAGRTRSFARSWRSTWARSNPWKGNLSMKGPQVRFEGVGLHVRR